jgi:tetratricopeptide (TPR) repeat protein
MRPYRSNRRRAAVRARVVFFLVIVGVTSALAGTRQAENAVTRLSFRPNDPATRRGFQHFYNLEYDAAIREFEIAVRDHPNDPFAVNHLLTGVMFRELYRIGALDTELYAKNGFVTSKQFPMDPKVKARIKELMERSLQLSEERLKKNPNDAEALYARGVTRGTRATYIGLIDKAWFAALRSAVAARRDHERVLELDPKFEDAKMLVGIHNYIMGSVSWPVKIAASVVGLSGSKSRGIAYLYEAGDAGGETAIDAKIALSLFLRREERYPEALKLVGGLYSEYPRNFLFALEYANLLNAAGHGPQAIAAYRRIIADGEAGAFAESHMEMAYYGIAEALRGQKEFEAAAAAYDHVGKYKVDPDLRQRAELGAGEMYDRLQKRDEALIRYREVLTADATSDHADIARKRIKKPYRE